MRRSRFSLLWLVSLGLSCTELDPTIDEATFQALTGRADTSASTGGDVTSADVADAGDRDEGAAPDADGAGPSCVRACGGTLAASAWAQAPGWLLQPGVTVSGDAVMKLSAPVDGQSGALLQGAAWQGGGTLSATLSLTLGTGQNASARLALEGGPLDAPTWEARLVADASGVHLIWRSDAGEAQKDVPDLRAGDLTSNVRIDLVVDCGKVQVTAAGATVEVATTGEIGLDRVRLAASDGAKVTYSRLALDTPPCAAGTSAPQCPECGGAGECEEVVCSVLATCVTAPVPDGTECSDQDGCTVGDLCHSGTCVGQAKSCDDGDPCTDDSCSGDGVCANGAVAGSPAPGSLFGSYDLEGAEKDQTDASGHGNGATLEGTDAAVAEGKGVDGGNALQVHGGTTLVVPNPKAGSGSFSVSGWFQPDGLPPSSERWVLFTQALGGGGSWTCGLDDDGVVRFRTDSEVLAEGPSLPAGHWSHVVCAHDAEAQVFRVLVDGVPGPDGAYPGGMTAFTVAEAVVRAGRTDNGAGGFHGRMDTLRVWTTALRSSPACEASGCSVAFCVSDDGCRAAQRTAIGCDDSNDCTGDTCGAASCEHTPKTATACDDGDACTGQDTCDNGTCVPGPVCAAPTCFTSECVAGQCTSPTLLACDDDDPCTTDACSQGTGTCEFTPLGTCTEHLDGFPGLQRIDLFEPEHIGTGGPGGSAVAATSLTRRQGDGRSSWQRADEPVEVPLRNALVDSAIEVYLPFEGDLTDHTTPANVVAYSDATPPPPLEQQFVAGGATDQAIRTGPGGVVVTMSPITGDLSMMGWFSAAPPSVPERAYVLGFDPAAGDTLRVDHLGQEWELVVGDQTTVIPSVSGDGWFHLAVTVGADLRVYANGLLVLVQPAPAWRPTGQFRIGGSTEQLEMGSQPTSPSPDADEVVVARRAFSGAEIAALVQSGRPFGAALVEGVSVQADWEDVRVTRTSIGEGTVVIPSEVIGRRPHGDSDAAMDAVAGYWRMDGDVEAVGGGKASSLGNAVATPGAFGDAGGALALGGPGTQLWTDRQTSLTGPLSVELWARLTGDGAGCPAGTLLQTASGPHGDNAGWRLDVCDGAARFQVADGGTTGTVQGTTAITGSGWHHVLVSVEGDAYRLYVDGLPDGEATGQVDLAVAADAKNPITVLHTLTMAGDTGQVLQGSVDEVILHTAARGAAYARDRAYPVLPTVRFLASTTAAGSGPYPLPIYAVHAGNPDAGPAPLPDGCSGPLLACIGTVGWWRFDDPVRGWARDLAAGGHHGAVPGQAAASVGPEGGALLLGADGGVTIPAVPDFALPAWTLEAVVVSTGAASDVISRQGGAGFFLRVSAAGAIEHGFGTGALASLSGGGTAGASALAGSYDGKTLTVVKGPAPPATKAAVGQPSLQEGLLVLGSSGLTLDAVRISDRALTDAERLHYPRLSWEPIANDP